jgi:hypothetical protein
MANQWAMDHQGIKYNNGKQQIIQKGFASGLDVEGFSGILGSNYYMDNVISTETANTFNTSYAHNDNIAQYGTKYNALKQKTQAYVNKSKNVENIYKNYNIFVNRSMGLADIEETNQKGCVTRDSISNLTLATRFAEAYPNNFPNYKDANNACKLWAADSANSVYAVTRDENWKYKCYIGSEVAPKITENTKYSTLYTVLDGDATSKEGGLFTNGQIGIWAGPAIPAAPKPNVEIDPKWNIKNMKKPMWVKKFNSNTYDRNEIPYFYARNDGWWGFSNPPPPSRANVGVWGVNMFPNSIAWWLGNLREKNTPRAGYSRGDGTKSYFYYVYNAPSEMPVFFYALSDSGFLLKINGLNKFMTPLDGSKSWWGSTLSMNLPAGQNVFEISTATGLPNSGFVFYAATEDKNTVLFKSGDPDWGVTMIPVPDYKMIDSPPVDQANPLVIKTLNPVPTGYNNCDVLMGGGIQKSSILASYGRNCSDNTMEPLNIRYIKLIPKDGRFLQISQIVVNAYVDSVITNVAGRGTTTATPSWQSVGDRPNYSPTRLAKDIPIDGTVKVRTYPNIYHAGYQFGNVFWELDLGQDYSVTQIVYYNRDVVPDRAEGMKMILSSNNETVYQPITLTAGAIQSFNISPKTMTMLN